MESKNNDTQEVKRKVEVAQSYLTFCDSMDCSPPGSSVYGILQARILEWVAVPFSWGSSQFKDQTQVSCIAGVFFFFLPPEPPGKSNRNKFTKQKETHRLEEQTYDC